MKMVTAIVKPFKLDEVREALHADRAQGLTHFVQLERLDDRGHHLHCESLPGL